MSPLEEEIAFFHQIGMALSQWAYVENQLVQVMSLCVSHPEHQRTLTIGFLSIENFRSKLQFCDNVIAHKFAGTTHLEYWNKIADKLKNASVKRNRVAHHLSVFFHDGKPGERYALIPWLDDSMTPAKAMPTASVKGGAVAPPGALRLRDVAGITAEFYQLMAALANLYELIRGRPEPFPGSPAPVADLPSLRWLRNQIRAGLGVPPRPSRKKLQSKDLTS